MQRLINLLSLDVVAGALAGGVMAVHLTGAQVGWPFWSCLGVTVWTVYTADHLLDAWRAGEKATSERHKFHFRNMKVLAAVMSLASIITLLVAFIFLESIILWFGLALGACIGLYLLVAFLVRQGKRYLQKEIFVAAFYTIGIWGGPLLLSDDNTNRFLILLPAAFFLLALADLLILSFFDEKTDRRSGFQSFAVTFGRKVTMNAALTAILLSLIIEIYIIMASPDKLMAASGYILIFMGLILAMHLIFSSFFARGGRYRYLNELIFLLPAFVVLF